MNSNHNDTDSTTLASDNDSATISQLTGEFHSPGYLRHTARRQEHLASLRLPLSGMSVLEVGAGIGDHSSYFIDRGCPVTITDARQENIDYLSSRYPKSDVRLLDLETPKLANDAAFDVVYCYGLLYHLKSPDVALAFLSSQTKNMLLLETCVSFGDESAINKVAENQSSPSQSFSGVGCRPTRKWIYDFLKKSFEHVYIPKTQPNHEEFPIDWTSESSHKAYLKRAIFIASRDEINNDALSTTLLNTQTKHE